MWRKALKFLQDYQSTYERKRVRDVQEGNKWGYLATRACKINFDAAKLGALGHRWGVITRDSEGDMLFSAIS